MTDENNSLVIDSGADPQALSYTPEAPEPKAPVEAKPMSSREALEKAAADIEAQGGKIGEKDAEAEGNEEKPKAEVKPAKERQPDGKFAAKEAAPAEDKETAGDEPAAKETEQAGETKERSSEDRDIDKPPARFLPRAKEKWSEVDPDVRTEVTRAMAEMDKGLQEHRESHEFRKELREFEEMAKGHGTTVKAALSNYVAIDNLLKSNPVAGVERILQSIGVTPQQYAQHVLQQPQRAPADPTVSRLEQTVQQLSQQLQQQHQTVQQEQQRASIQHIENTLFNEVRAEHPRFDELRADIAFFWNSDKLSSITDERQRLFAATDMAERINPSGNVQQNTGRLKPAQTDDRPLNPAGAKSIKGAPNGTSVPKGANLNSKDAIEAAMRQLGL